MIEYAYARSPMYRKLLDRHKVRPEQVRTMDDFVKRLPVIDKHEILDAQAVSPPFGEALAISPDFFHQRFATSGSTGAPTSPGSRGSTRKLRPTSIGPLVRRQLAALRDAGRHEEASASLRRYLDLSPEADDAEFIASYLVGPGPGR